MTILSDSTYFPWLLGIAAALLLAALAWRRPNPNRRVWRVLASILAGISLVLLVFPPSIRKTINPTTAILLTPDFNADTLAALLDTSVAAPQFFSYKTKADKATAIPHLYTLKQKYPALQTLHILGEGLEQEDLQLLQPINLVPHVANKAEGIQTVSWPESIKLGERVTVTGKYKATNPARLYLQASGRVRDSLQVKPDSTYTFALNYTPKQEGRFTYQLLAKIGEKQDTLGQIPVQVQPVKPLRILILASFPQFEFKFLKNHLGQLQHKVALRSTVSKGINQSEWVNMPETNLSKITPKLLETFDVVITEPQALQSMNATERNALQQAVTENGLGVLTIASEPATNRNTTFFTSFRSQRLSQQDTRTANATWAGTGEAALTVAPYSLIPTTALTSLVTEKGNNLLAGFKKAGWGKVGFSFAPQTFPWQLEGKEAVYARYWAHVISEIAKPESSESFWQIQSPQVPLVNKPVILQLTDYTLADATPKAQVFSLKDSLKTDLTLAQIPLQPEQFTGTFWPQQTGWHVIQSPEKAPYYFFVQDTSDWQFAASEAKREATLAFASNQGIKPMQASIAYQEEPISIFWFFVLFVLSSGYLWLEEKL